MQQPTVQSVKIGYGIMLWMIRLTDRGQSTRIIRVSSAQITTPALAVESAIRLDLCTIGQVKDAIQGRVPAHILNPKVLKHPRVKAFCGDAL